MNSGVAYGMVGQFGVSDDQKKQHTNWNIIFVY